MKRPRFLSSSERAFLQVAANGELHVPLLRIASNHDHDHPYLARRTTYRGATVRQVVLLRLLRDGILVAEPTSNGSGVIDITPYGQACAEMSRLRLEAATITVPDDSTPVSQ